jgi:hypothetical protein
MANVLVIDVGSHKAEEVYLLDGAPYFSPRNRYRVLRGSKYSPGRAAQELRAIAHLSQEFRRKHTSRFVMIEPVMHPELLRFLLRTESALLINGVSSCDPSGPTTLFMSGSSLGNSIIKTKPGLSGETRNTFNVNFEALYEFLVQTFVQSGDCEKIVLRMNAEGVEGPIIEYLAKRASVKPAVLAGSIGDIKKCFGQEAYDKALADLAGANIPYIYFTSSTMTWSPGLKDIMAALA